MKDNAGIPAGSGDVTTRHHPNTRHPERMPSSSASSLSFHAYRHPVEDRQVRSYPDGARPAGRPSPSVRQSSWIEKAGLGAHRAKASTVSGGARALSGPRPDSYERLRGDGTVAAPGGASTARGSRRDGRDMRTNLRVIPGKGGDGVREGSRTQGDPRARGGSRRAVGPHVRLAASSPHTSWGFQGEVPASSRGHMGRIGGEVERGIQGTAHLGEVPGTAGQDDEAADARHRSPAGAGNRLKRIAGLLRTPSQIPAALLSWCRSLWERGWSLVHGRSAPQLSLSVGKVIAALMLVAVFALYPVARNYYQNLREQARLDAEYQALVERNATIQDEIDYLNTDQGVEDAARTQFDYVMPGEHVAVVPDAGSTTSSTSLPAPVRHEEVEVPSTWYTPFLDTLFGVRNT